MPRKGEYSLELVEATTKEPFKEYDGEINIDSYVEVEPDIEYFIKVHNHSKKTVVNNFWVDGKLLETNNTVSPKRFCRKGLNFYDAQSQQRIKKALKFDKISSQSSYQRTSSDEQRNDAINEEAGDTNGIIKVEIYEKIYLDGYHFLESRKPKFTNDHSISNALNSQNDTKLYLHSQQGNFEERKKDRGKRRNCKRGALLETITVKYCTTLRLIHEGILPKPPLWDYYKLTNPQIALNGNTSTIVKPTEMFDLSLIGHEVDLDCNSQLNVDNNDGNCEQEHENNILPSIASDDACEDEEEVQPKEKRKVSEISRHSDIYESSATFPKVSYCGKTKKRK